MAYFCLANRRDCLDDEQIKDELNALGDHAWGKPDRTETEPAVSPLGFEARRDGGEPLGPAGRARAVGQRPRPITAIGLPCSVLAMCWLR